MFPAQGGAELVQDLFASGVIQPVVDFSSVAEGSVLPENLQTAWDFSTTHTVTVNTVNTIINNPGFWLLHGTFYTENVTGTQNGTIQIFDGTTRKQVWQFQAEPGAAGNVFQFIIPRTIIFLRAGDSLEVSCAVDTWIRTETRQIADVYGNLVNPLGFTFS